MIEPDPPLTPFGLETEWKLYSEASMAGKLRPVRNNGEVCEVRNWRNFLIVPETSNSISAQSSGMLLDQIMKLKAENFDLRKINSELGDEIYDLRRQSNRIAFLEAALETAKADLLKYENHIKAIVDDQIAEAEGPLPGEGLSRALRLPNTPDPYGR